MNDGGILIMEKEFFFDWAKTMFGACRYIFPVEKAITITEKDILLQLEEEKRKKFIIKEFKV